MQQRPVDAARGQPGGAPDQDFEYTWSDRDDTAASYDHEPVTAPIPIPAAEVQHLVPDQPDDYAWDEAGDVPAGGVQVVPEPVDVYDLVPDQPDDHEWEDERGEVPTGAATVLPDEVEAREPFGDEPDDYGWDDHDEVPPAPIEVRPLRARPFDVGELVHPAVGMPMPEYRPLPWYRTKQAVTVLAAAAVVALVCGGWLVLRSPSTIAEQSKIEAPTSAPPAPSSVQPTAMSAPQPPPPPAPPPPPSPPAGGPVYSGPQRQYSEPRRSAPPEAKKPEIGATRTPATRAPISVAPVPRPVAGSDSSTPGDAPGERPRRRGCFGFC